MFSWLIKTPLGGPEFKILQSGMLNMHLERKAKQLGRKHIPVEPLVYITIAVSFGLGSTPVLLDISPKRITSLYGSTLTSPYPFRSNGLRASSITTYKTRVVS